MENVTGNIEELKQRFEALQKRKESLNAEVISLTSASKLYKENYDKALAELKEKYGVDSLEEAKKLLQEKETQLLVVIETCEKELGVGNDAE